MHDQPVRCVAPFLRRHQCGEIVFHLTRRLAERDAQAMRDAKDVRIDRKRASALNAAAMTTLAVLRPTPASDSRWSRSCGTRPPKRSTRSRAQRDDVLRLHPKEATRLDDLFDIGLPRTRELLRRRIFGEERRRGRIDPRVGALRRENHRDEQFELAAILECGHRVRVACAPESRAPRVAACAAPSSLGTGSRARRRYSRSATRFPSSRDQAVALQRGRRAAAPPLRCGSADRRTTPRCRSINEIRWPGREIAQPVDDAAARVARRAPKWDAALRRAPLRREGTHSFERRGIDRRRGAVVLQRAEQTFRRSRACRSSTRGPSAPNSNRARRPQERARGRVRRVRARSRRAGACSGPKARPVDDAADVRIDRRVVDVEREGSNRCRSIGDRRRAARAALRASRRQDAGMPFAGRFRRRAASAPRASYSQGLFHSRKTSASDAHASASRNRGNARRTFERRDDAIDLRLTAA